jgi:hypothetical protein
MKKMHVIMTECSTAEHGASVLKKAVEEHAAAPLDQPHVLRRVPLIIVQMIG